MVAFLPIFKAGLKRLHGYNFVPHLNLNLHESTITVTWWRWEKFA